MSIHAFHAMQKLGLFIGKTVLVCIPSLFDDGRVRPCRLLGIEIHGLWLESQELRARLLPQGLDIDPSIAISCFVPFSQISGVLVAAATPADGQASAEPALTKPGKITRTAKTRQTRTN